MAANPFLNGVGHHVPERQFAWVTMRRNDIPSSSFVLPKVGHHDPKTVGHHVSEKVGQHGPKQSLGFR
jgi:hypothetical protein